MNALSHGLVGNEIMNVIYMPINQSQIGNKIIKLNK